VGLSAPNPEGLPLSYRYHCGLPQAQHKPPCYRSAKLQPSQRVYLIGAIAAPNPATAQQKTAFSPPQAQHSEKPCFCFAACHLYCLVLPLVVPFRFFCFFFRVGA
jgi:hypothetical protein